MSTRRSLFAAWATAFALLPAACGFSGSEPGSAGPCPVGDTLADGRCYTGGYVAKLNSVGFLPGRIKVMTVSAPPTEYRIRAVGGDVAQTGQTEGPLVGDTGEENLQKGDFTSLIAPGDYFVEIPGLGVSPVFHVGDDAFDGAFKTLMLGMFGWRCGMAVSLSNGGHTFSHGAASQCWQRTAWSATCGFSGEPA